MSFHVRTVKGEQVRDNGTQTIRWDSDRGEWIVYCRARKRHFRGFLSAGNARDFCGGMSRRVVLASCGATKLDRPAPAADLYTGSLFRKARSYAEASGHPWYIVSALHGLVETGTVLEPYDVKIADLTPEARMAWAGRVARDLFLRGFGGWGVFELHTGESYARPLRHSLAPVSLNILEPLAGLGIGQRLRWYATVGKSQPTALDPDDASHRLLGLKVGEQEPAVQPLRQPGRVLEKLDEFDQFGLRQQLGVP